MDGGPNFSSKQASGFLQSIGVGGSPRKNKNNEKNESGQLAEHFAAAPARREQILLGGHWLAG
jgi:hypothetical protein